MICGVVILYNPEQDVVENINSYICGLDLLFVVDNSCQENQDIINKVNCKDKIVYIKNKNNEGVAKALNIGAVQAKKNGCKYLLTMDQDSMFSDNQFKEYVKMFFNIKNEQIALVSPLQSSYTYKKKNMFKVDEPFIVITSGNIIDLHILEKVGYFDEKLFIDGVDWDYCIRLQQQGYKIIRFNDIILAHHLGSMSRHKNIFKKEISIHQHNALRRYYMTRNWLYLSLKYSLKYPRFSLSTIKNLLREIKNILLYESDKYTKLKWVYKGFVDFLFGKYGKKNV